jgi:DNA-binding Xre family transcriptional regulator
MRTLGKKMITYKRLWELMATKHISQYFLKANGISNSTLTRLKRDEAVSTETINKLCVILECKVEDIMEYLNKP